MTYIATVFSGIGAAEFAARKIWGESFKNIFACEIDKFARIVYSANHKIDEAVFYKDIKGLDASAFRGKIDILIGGSPCQDFSRIGLRAGVSGDRGNLIWQYYRIVKECRPKVFVFENVKGFLSIEKGRAYVNFLNALRDLGYRCHAEILNTKDYGIPQNRERLYIIGFLNADEYYAFKLAPKTSHNKLADYLDENVGEKYFLSERLLAYFESKHLKFKGKFYPKDENRDCANTLTTNPGHRRTDNFIIQRPHGFNKGYELEICPTITTSNFTNNNLLKTERIRKLTPRECLRLQGFSDDFKIAVSDTQTYKQAGNAMSVNVIEMILRQIEAAKDKQFKLGA